MNNLEDYLDRKKAKLPKSNSDILDKGVDMHVDEVLAIEDKNHILRAGYLKGENGFYHFENRSAYAAVLTIMPKVTIEMIDWWFWWHAKDTLRYRIWYPEMHFAISSDFGNCYDDNSLTYRERLHRSKHFVTEDIGTGKEKIVIDFMSPVEFGFNKGSLKRDSEETIICARVGDLRKRVWHTHMCHAVRKTEDGVEMRSRFWMALQVERMDDFAKGILDKILNKSIVKKKLLPSGLGRHMFHHCTQEYNNLAEILPELYKNGAHK